MHLDPKCSTDSHICKRVCISEKCKVANPFVCQNKGCHNAHAKECNIVYYKKLVREFHKIQGLFTQQILHYQERVQNTFRELMEGLQKQFIKFREQFEYMHITQKISNIYEKIRRNCEKQLTGSIISYALKQKPLEGIKLNVKDEVAMRLQKQQILETHMDLLSQLPPYYSFKQQVKIDYEGLPAGKSRLKDIQNQFLPKRRQPSGLILPYFSDFQKMLGKEIYNLHLLYRATENNFDAKIFHKKCDGVKNTCTVAKTEFGKIVIGYCTFPWQSHNTWQYKQDINNQCFLLSPSETLKSKKFTAFKKKFAIGMHQDYGPSFGDDFVIYDKANNSKNCWSNFPDVYTCKTVKVPHDEKTIKQFVGVDDHFQKFNLVEWQVFKISFGREEQIQPAWKKGYRKIK